ncbi:MAG: cytochrome c [Chitinophagaceae bacterium]|nr:cytochrome c [Chitinophagaceae bacterium]
MKKIFYIISIFLLAAGFAGCNKPRRSPGRIYMPDMTYNRAYETYTSTEELKKSGATYTGMPVAGTVARDESAWNYPYGNDSAGYALSKNISNPLPKLNDEQFQEAERLYLIHCAICHGAKLDGNGPLYKDGDGPYPAKPATLVGDPKYETMADGTMYHSITYGINAMGSYASQLSPEQRWMIIHYIREKQKPGSGKSGSSVADSSAVTKMVKK